MKIKKVEVQAFRAYLEKANGTFDFMVPDQDGVDVPANFISLYAPNGFGKSSFYDAVEWAMTNGSERFSDGVYEAAARGSKLEDEALRILRNTEAPDDLETLVSVSTTVQDFVRSPGIIRKDSIDVDFKEKKLAEGAEAYRTIFLSQDAIDHFIRGVNPESRYQTFIDVYGEESELLRREVQAAYLGVGEQIEKCKATEKKLSAEIEAPLNNHLVETFIEVTNELRVSGVCLRALQETIGDTKLDELAEELITSSSKAQHDLELLAARELALNELAEGLINNISDSDELARQLTKERSLLDALGEVGKRDALLQAQAEYVTEINRRTDELQRLESVIAVSEKYRSLHGKKLALGSELGAQNLESKSLELKRDQFTAQRRELLKRLTDLQERKATWDILRSNSINIYENIERSTKDQVELDVGLRDSTAKIALLIAKLADQTDSLSAINQMPEDVFEMGIKDLALLGLDADHHSELRAARAENVLIERKLDTINHVIQDLESQANAFGKLAAVAGEILSSHPGRNCPLCQKDHGSFEALQAAIDSNGKLQGVLKENSDRRSVETDNLAKSKKLLSDMAAVLSNHREKTIRQLEVEIRSTTDEELSAKRKKSSIEARLASLKQEMILNKAIVLNLAPDQLSTKITEELKGFSAQIEASQAELDTVDKELESLSSIKVSTFSKASDINTQLTQIDADQDYTLVFSFLEEYKCDPSGTDKDLEIFTAELRSKIKDFETLWSEADDVVKSIKESLENANLPADSLLIENDLDLCIARLSELRGRIESYSSRFITLLGVSQADHADYEERLGAAIEETLAGKQKANDSSVKLGELRALLDSISPVISREVARREMGSTIQRRVEYESLREQIGAELTVINEVLERQLDTVFQTDLINEIYRKIDPHPNFSKVRFSCGFGLKNRPTLNVMVRDKESEKEISPLLYFSAAQLNILSLSIFLARALNAKSPTGESLDLILIDDPIHSMDSINVLSTIDLLRGIAINHDKQIVISTHDENFYELLKRKVPAGLCLSKFLKLKSFGRVEVDD
ncbi:hypothetical protein [Pseudomonas sp. 1121_17]|jgi:transcriptional regulator NrdR family protein|uniref:hypothetical protein n=1 Tax=Pseudomonas sp. 1121_17 TaxID=2604458 RepID=UPI0040638933